VRPSTHLPFRTKAQRILVLGVALVLVVAAATVTSATAASYPRRPVFVMYYLWWSGNHWEDMLGPNYPHNQTPSPLPASVDSSGCGARTLYSGNQLTDVSPSLSYDQDDAAAIERDVRRAASLGVRGFAVNWKGDGTSSQNISSTNFNQRLQDVFDAVHKVNAEGIRFKVMLNYQASAETLPRTAFENDLSYFLSHYGSDSALDHTYSSKPELIWAGSWKYTDSVITTVSQRFRSRLYLIGDETPSTWDATRADRLDGGSYYWSSQDPYGNPASFTQLQDLATNIRSGTNPDGRPKTWLAPFTPGYNAKLLDGGSTCVPRNSGRTMHELFQGNRASNPDGWTFISWNEIAEGTYIVPLARYGTEYTNELKTLIANNR
jgi:hypothetical protein